MDTCAIILAAGAGTRMKSKKPKVAHEILGMPLVNWVERAVRQAGVSKTVVVVGHERQQVTVLLHPESEIAIQEHRLGTGDAVLSAKDALKNFTGSVVILSADSPMITPETITMLLDQRSKTGNACVVLTMNMDTPFGYGRIVRDDNGNFARIVEEKDCTPTQAQITECNSGIYCFDASVLFESLGKLSNNNAQGEYYLTDTLEIALAHHGEGSVVSLVASDANECAGVNSREQLAQATKCLQTRINKAHMQAGVTFTNPCMAWIGPDVKIASDVEILPMCTILGDTQIGEDSVIGPSSTLKNAVVGKNCTINETIATDVIIHNNVTCGPRAYLRPGTVLKNKSKVGTCVEVKKSIVGEGSKIPHLSYIGDAEIGNDVNIGAGSITCNYDGKNKHATTIEDGAFIGSDTMLVAPVKVGKGAVTGAGSAITEDVSDGALAIGRARQVEISNYSVKS